MTQDEIIEMGQEAGLAAFIYPHLISESEWKQLSCFIELVAAKEREACEALHEHEDVQAPVGNSSWGEAYQEGWAQGTAAYRAAIRARGEQA